MWELLELAEQLPRSRLRVHTRDTGGVNSGGLVRTDLPEGNLKDCNSAGSPVERSEFLRWQCEPGTHGLSPPA